MSYLTDIPSEKVFDVVNIPCSVKHAQIIQRWKDLRVGDYFVLKNDHDPIPLRYQFVMEFPQQFEWVYLERGPAVFSVKISRLKAA